MNTEKVLADYLECALWASTDDNGDPLDSVWTTSDFSQEAILLAKNDIEKFLKVAILHINENVEPGQIGHDFWLGRNYHGSSFFDRPEIYGEPNADKLTELAQTFGEKYIYVQNNLLEFE